MAAPDTTAGHEAPREPERSLPSYSEPPLREKRRLHLDREEVAERDLKGTTFGRDACGLLIAVFLLTITLPALVQFAAELRAGRGFPSFDFLRALPKWQKIHAARNPADFWNLAPQATDIRDFEKGMEKGSVISRWLLPPVQNVLTGALGAGNEQAYPGWGGWLFYRPDVEYAMGPPFLDPDQLARRSGNSKVRPDPIPAILDFRDQLKARGIELVLFPVPVKPVKEGEMLSANVKPDSDLQNPSFSEFMARMQKEGVPVFDPVFLYGYIFNHRPPASDHAPPPEAGMHYLETDTHWRPESMEFAARRVGSFIDSNAKPNPSYTLTEKQVTSLGDIALMLKLPAGQTIYRPQTVTIHQVNVGNAPWRATPSADVLLLGDSFSNIYSLEGMGWGESAGFAEHLSYNLGKPIDAILRNSDGSFATREILSRELARGRDRLAGKKVVVWEFASRELSAGNWKLLPMKLGQMPESRFFHPTPGGSYVLTGTVQTVSSVPLPGSVPYKDHILTVQLADLTPVAEGVAPAPPGKKSVGGMLQALVYLPSMRDNAWTPAARLRPGDQVTVRLRAWSDVAAQYEKINRSEPDDPALQLEEPVWGELER